MEERSERIIDVERCCDCGCVAEDQDWTARSLEALGPEHFDRAPASPSLSDTEEAEINDLLEAHPGAASFAWCQGFFVAARSIPIQIDVHAWLECIFGESAAFDSAGERARVICLLGRFHESTLANTDEGLRLSCSDPDDEAGMALWCRGYMAAFERAGLTIAAEPECADALAVINAIARWCPACAEGKLAAGGLGQGKTDSPDALTSQQLEAMFSEWRADVPLLAMACFAHWKIAGAAATPPSGPSFGMPKIGRNDPCPCGSELKFKKCCLLSDADSSGRRGE